MRQLVTLEEVKRHMAEQSDRHDDEIEDLIEEASEKFIRKCGRELLPENPAEHNRVFDVSRDVVHYRELELGDLSAQPVQVKLYDVDGVTLLQTIPAAAFVCLPRRRESWQPISHLRFLANVVDAAALSRGQSLEVRGVWGFPAVPADIKREVRKTVQAWLARDVKQTSQTYQDAKPGFTKTLGQHELPLSAAQACESYRVGLGGGAD